MMWRPLQCVVGGSLPLFLWLPAWEVDMMAVAPAAIVYPREADHVLEVPEGGQVPDDFPEMPV